MKYTIHGYSQSKAIEIGLDDRDLMILRWFVDYKDSGKMASKIIDNEIYYWIKYTGIQEAFPIVAWKKDTVYRRLKGMAEKGILKHKTIKERGTWSFYAIGEKYLELVDTIPIGNKSEGVGNKSVTNNSSINNSSINDSIKSSTKVEGNKKVNPLLARIDDYTSNEDLRKALIDFMDYRKENHKPLTDRAFTLLTNKLDKITSSDKYKIAMLEQSILNGYQGIFEIKGYKEDISYEHMSHEDMLKSVF